MVGSSVLLKVTSKRRKTPSRRNPARLLICGKICVRITTVGQITLTFLEILLIGVSISINIDIIFSTYVAVSYTHLTLPTIYSV